MSEQEGRKYARKPSVKKGALSAPPRRASVRREEGARLVPKPAEESIAQDLVEEQDTIVAQREDRRNDEELKLKMTGDWKDSEKGAKARSMEEVQIPIQELCDMPFTAYKFTNPNNNTFSNLMLFVLFGWGFPSHVVPVLLGELCTIRKDPKGTVIVDMDNCLEKIHLLGWVHQELSSDDELKNSKEWQQGWEKVNYIIEKAKNLCLLRCKKTPVVAVTEYDSPIDFSEWMVRAYEEELLVKEHVFFKTEDPDKTFSIDGKTRMLVEPIENGMIEYDVWWAVGRDFACVDIGEDDGQWYRLDGKEVRKVTKVTTISDVRFCCFRAQRCFRRTEDDC